jgi:hypothetical protein
MTKRTPEITTAHKNCTRCFTGEVKQREFLKTLNQQNFSPLFIGILLNLR